MEELDTARVTKKSIHGVFALTTRTFFIQIVTFISNLLLTIYLAPEVFGIFFVVSAAIAFLSYFSDIGLAAALIQKKENITQDDLKTTFTIQQILVLTVVLIALLSSGIIGRFYNLTSDGILLFQALSVSFFLSSLKTIPSIILERNLDFKKLVIPQIVETLFFNVVAVVLAIQGFGVASFTYAVLARGLTGLITMYLISPWRISVGITKQSARRLLSFGFPFQLNSFLALVKDDLLIVYLGKVLPLAQVGYIGFAQKWALMPLRLIMDNVIRITFPSFSRLQDEKEVLSKAIEKSIFAACFLIFPALTGLVILSPYFINLIPKYIKWEPALLSLFFFSINAALSSVSTPLTNALNAIGKIKTTLYLMIFWTISTWVLTPFLIIKIGFNGVAIASAIISLSVVLVVILVKRYISFNIKSAVFYPILSSSVMGVVLYFLASVIASSLLGVFVCILFSAMLYFLVSFILAKEQIKKDFALIRQSLKR
ncbi:MAG: polysaccharide biosynthesis protein [Candidatus Levybacteria bacterium]|nr:polysaccharide biosynthesis protein [Candidatus Levybacteria bacterium]